MTTMTVCDLCEDEPTVITMTPIVDDNSRSYGPRLPEMRVCADCCNQVMAQPGAISAWTWTADDTGNAPPITTTAQGGAS
jgi:hypothetical protein